MSSEVAATNTDRSSNRASAISVLPMVAGVANAQSTSYFEEMFLGRIGLGAARFVSEISRSVPALLKALQIGAGDEVIVSCLASRGILAAIEAHGARPILCDVDPANLQLCSWAVDAAVTPRTRAVVATHLHGVPCNMLALLGVAASHDLILIEDCTQATGARVLGQQVGSFGHASLFSCAPADQAMDFAGAGIIASRDADLFNKIDDEAFASVAPDEAAMGYDEFLMMESHTEARRHTAEIYTDVLSIVPEVQLPNIYEDSAPSWWRYVVRVQHRDALLSYLWEKGIFAEPVQPPAQTFGPIIRLNGRCRDDCYANRAAELGIMLPVSDDMDPTKAYAVCCEIRAFYDTPNRGMKVVPVPGTTVENFTASLNGFFPGKGARA